MARKGPFQREAGRCFWRDRECRQAVVESAYLRLQTLVELRGASGWEVVVSEERRDREDEVGRLGGRVDLEKRRFVEVVGFAAGEAGFHGSMDARYTRRPSFDAWDCNEGDRLCSPRGIEGRFH